MKTAQIGLVGLAVMWANLARNIASRGIDISVYNRTQERTESFIQKFGNDHLFAESYAMADFVASIERPRNVIVMVQAGKPVDMVIEELSQYLESGDCIIDCWNSFYRDTIRREALLATKGIRFVGCGISGGEEGALKGPSIMPGGNAENYERVRPIFEKIAARDFKGNPCVTHVGTGASWHFVKMVHNGIEYAVMQIMAEAYDALRKLYRLSAPEIADIFEGYSQEKLDSYLFDISLSVLRKTDDLRPGQFLIDSILDSAGQKWTGKWVVIEALERGIAVPSIAEAVFARNVSSMKKLRLDLAEKYVNLPERGLPDLVDFRISLKNALYASILSSYSQGYDLIAKASESEGWNVNLAEITRIWEWGCIIRAEILVFLHSAFLYAPAWISHLFAIPEVIESLEDSLDDWHQAVGIMSEHGMAIPAISSSLSYFESLTDARHPANYLQGLRDYFWAHMYERTDCEGVFHSEWSE